MRKWLARKMFDLAVRLDWDASVEAAQVVVLIDGQLKAAFDDEQWRTHVWVPAKEKDRVARKAPTPPKKRGRPLGSKNKSAPKKIGRPLGSKNKPKVQP